MLIAFFSVNILFSLIAMVNTSRILAVFPTPCISHQVVFRSLTTELARRGHELVVVTTDPAFPEGNSPSNYKEIDVHDVSYEMWTRLVQANSNRDDDSYSGMKMAQHLLLMIFEEQLKSIEFQELLGDSSRTIDLVFIEACVHSTQALSHIFKAPVIQISSFGMIPGTDHVAGVPSHPLLYPSVFRKTIHNMTIWEQLIEYYNYYTFEKYFLDFEELENSVMKRILDPNLPNVSKWGHNIQMFFVNTHRLWDFSRPVPSNFLYLGGLHQKFEESLPTELKNYLDISTNGVIYMSLGTNVQLSLLPPGTVQMFLKVFSTLPYNVLLKSDKELEGRPSNVQISNWFPQSDLLRHPNIKLFITQAGLQSTDEAISAGVPLIGIPTTGDQWFNAELYGHHKIGVKLSLESLTEQEFENAINMILHDASYRSNVMKLRAFISDQQFGSLERAVRWTEHVLRHGGAGHLRPPAANMHWTQYYEIQLVAELILCALSSLAIVFIILYRCFMYIYSYFNKNRTDFKTKGH